MRRQLLQPVLWLIVVLIVGSVEFLRVVPRIVAVLKFKGVLALATIVVLWRSDGLPLGQLLGSAVGPQGHMIAATGAVVTVTAVLCSGIRSAARRRLWRQLRAWLRFA